MHGVPHLCLYYNYYNYIYFTGAGLNLFEGDIKGYSPRVGLFSLY